MNAERHFEAAVTWLFVGSIILAADAPEVHPKPAAKPDGDPVNVAQPAT